MILTICAVTCMFMFSPAPVGAVERLGSDDSLLTYFSQNTTVLRADTLVPVTTIIPGKHRILGFVITPQVAGCTDGTVELYDEDATADMSTANIWFAYEVQTGTNTINGEMVLFPYPKAVSLGLCIRQGNRTNVTILYEKYR